MNSKMDVIKLVNKKEIMLPSERKPSEIKFKTMNVAGERNLHGEVKSGGPESSAAENTSEKAILKEIKHVVNLRHCQMCGKNMNSERCAIAHFNSIGHKRRVEMSQQNNLAEKRNKDKHSPEKSKESKVFPIEICSVLDQCEPIRPIQRIEKQNKNINIVTHCAPVGSEDKSMNLKMLQNLPKVDLEPINDFALNGIECDYTPSDNQQRKILTFNPVIGALPKIDYSSTWEKPSSSNVGNAISFMQYDIWGMNSNFPLWKSGF